MPVTEAGYVCACVYSEFIFPARCPGFVGFPWFFFLFFLLFPRFTLTHAHRRMGKRAHRDENPAAAADDDETLTSLTVKR